ncbi:vitamin K epoxide reductase family protein [Alistipes sp.]|uniref:vitamin K epoxide reductase family protein n=1 Tax=Alistipes sp. TaxID=1872444 RepID=UPI0011DCCB4A|nr:vitamin K epoxide reductase family protein [Alistipes sp.]
MPLLLHLFLSRIGIRISLLRIREAYARHALPHSVRALSDTLDALRVPNMVCRLEFGQLFEIGGPFLVKAGEAEYPFLLVERLDRERQTIALRTAEGRYAELPFDAFRAVWDGTVLLAEKGDEIVEEPWPLYRVRQGLDALDRRWGRWLAGLLVVVAAVAALRAPEFAELRYLVKAAGLALSFAVVVKASFDPHLAQGFCRLGRRSDCNEVFRAAGAKLFGWVSLGELSAVYFAASILWGLFVAADPGALFPWLDMLALSTVGYSLVWQMRHRRWCPLCLAIDAVLVADAALEALLGAPWRPVPDAAFAVDALLFGLLFGAGVLALRRIVVAAERVRETDRLKYKHERLLSDSALFWQLLERQPKAAAECSSCMPITNYAEAEHTLTVVMNPSCPKCAEVHRALAGLEGYRIELLFAVNEGDGRSRDAALRMISSGISDEWPQTERIVGAWYERHELPPGQAVHPLAGEDLDRHRDYCRAVGITGTPTILVDGRRLPDLYDATDLKYLL